MFPQVKELERENQRLLENERYLKRGFAEATAKGLLATATLDAEGKPLELAKLDLQLDTQLDELQFEEGDANLDTADELLQLEKRVSDLTLLRAKDVASNSLQGNLIQWGRLQPGHMTHSSIDHPRSLFRSDSKEFKDVGSPLVVESEQEVAFASSVFSAMLLTLVAVISMEAKDPCAPLRNALLMVVALSLANVVKFFTKVESRQGIYAVALISLNFFMLGTLAYPSLPYIGRFASVVLWSIGGRTLKLFGFESLRTSNLELQQSIERT
jgi:hypothetical protein